LKPDLRVVFCGTAAGAASARAGAYYAGPGNKFWRTLHEVGFMPRRIEPHRYKEILEFDLGLTDVNKSASGSDRAIGDRSWDVPGLRTKIDRFGPIWIAFNGKKAAEVSLGRKVDYGLQPELIGTTRVFVLPSTSGAASGAWSRAPWEALATLVTPSR
jgi:TDG/mug DNA glycosylase family protein